MSAPETGPVEPPKGVIAALDRFFGRLNDALGLLVAVSLALFALGITADLVIRRLGIGNLPWLYETIEYVLYAGVFLAAPWVLREGAHVRVDLLPTALPRTAAIRLERILDILGAIVCLVLCYYGWRAGVDAFVDNSRQFKTLVVSDWWLMSIFTVALLLLAIEFLLRLGRTGESLVRGDNPAARPGL